MKQRPTVQIVMGVLLLVFAAINGYLAYADPAGANRTIQIGLAAVFTVLGIGRILRGLAARRLAP